MSDRLTSDRSIPTLDGLRAVSIGCVLVAHLSNALGRPSGFAWAAGLGHLGVHVFFVLSGYLITTLLVREYERTGTVSLRGFVWRRMTRIVPAYAVYLLAVWLFAPPELEGRWLPLLTYTSNWIPTGSWITAHTWSLSIEEQFYVTWPLAMLLLTPRHARWLALAVAAASPGIRPLLYLVTKHGELAATWNFDFIALGCALALWRPRGFTMRPAWLAPVTAIAIAIGFWGAYGLAGKLYLVAGLSVEAMAITATLAYCLANPESVAGRVLETRPMKFLGLVSYSVYLWQEPFLLPHYRLVPLWLAPLCVLAVATASYYGVERPGLELRHWGGRRAAIRSASPRTTAL